MPLTPSDSLRTIACAGFVPIGGGSVCVGTSVNAALAMRRPGDLANAGKEPSGNDHFGVNLMPQTASTEEPPAVPSAHSAAA